jgi:hypothetical protein
VEPPASGRESEPWTDSGHRAGAPRREGGRTAIRRNLGLPEETVIPRERATALARARALGATEESSRPCTCAAPATAPSRAVRAGGLRFGCAKPRVGSRWRARGQRRAPACPARSRSVGGRGGGVRDTHPVFVPGTAAALRRSGLARGVAAVIRKSQQKRGEAPSVAPPRCQWSGACSARLRGRMRARQGETRGSLRARLRYISGRCLPTFRVRSRPSANEGHVELRCSGRSNSLSQQGAISAPTYPFCTPAETYGVKAQTS